MMSSFKTIFLVSQILGIAMCGMTLYYVIHYRRGLTVEFNWHIISAVVGLVYFYAFELLTYRFLHWLSMKTLNLIHAGIGAIIIGCTIVVFLTIYGPRNRNRSEAENWTTMHDWFGMVTALIFVSQWAFSVAAYLYPKMSVSIRVGYLPFHVFIGHVAFALSVLSCISGFMEMSNYERPEDYVLGSICFLMIGFATLAVYLSTTQCYKRIPLDSD